MSIFQIISSVPFQFDVGDPSLMGWLTVLAYLTAALLCLACSLYAGQIFATGNIALHRVIWLSLAAVLLFLGINKQLDFQSWFTTVAKAIAWEQGWYEYGQRSQIYFLAAFGFVGLMAIICLAWLVRHHWRNYILLLLGFFFILRFISVRIGTFYGINLPELSRFTGGIRINHMLELIGTTVIAVSALNNLRQRANLPPTIPPS